MEGRTPDSPIGLEVALTRSRLRPATKRSYRAWIDRLIEHSGKEHKRLDVADVRDFIRHLKEVEKASLQTLRSARSASRFGLIARKHPKARHLNMLVPVDGLAGPPEFFEEDQLRPFLEVGSLRRRTIATLLFGCGLELNEVIALRVGDFFGGSVLMVRRRGADEPRRVPVSQRDAATLVRYLKTRARLFQFDGGDPTRGLEERRLGFSGLALERWEREPLLPGRRSDVDAPLRLPLSARQTQNVVSELAEASRLPLSARNLRASYAVRELRRGVLPETVARRMGLSNLRSIQRYVWLVEGKQSHRRG